MYQKKRIDGEMAYTGKKMKQGFGVGWGGVGVGRGCGDKEGVGVLTCKRSRAELSYLVNPHPPINGWISPVCPSGWYIAYI